MKALNIKSISPLGIHSNVWTVTAVLDNCTKLNRQILAPSADEARKLFVANIEAVVGKVEIV